MYGGHISRTSRIRYPRDHSSVTLQPLGRNVSGKGVTRLSVTRQSDFHWKLPNLRTNVQKRDTLRGLSARTYKAYGYIEVKQLDDNKHLVFLSKKGSVKETVLNIKRLLGITDDDDVLLYSGNKDVLSETGSLQDCHGRYCFYEVHKQQDRYHKVLEKYSTSDPDLIDPCEDEEPRIRMSCGHAITQKNLYEYTLHTIKGGAITVKCPALPNPDSQKRCEKEWEFFELDEKNCLSKPKRRFLLDMLFSNWCGQKGNVYRCPWCRACMESTCGQLGYFECKSAARCRGRYCNKCYRRFRGDSCPQTGCIESVEAMAELLKNCDTKTIVGVPNCPVIRACPKCNALNEHLGDACKHLDCTNMYCKAVFCFVCLAIKDEFWPDSCGGAFLKCTKAPTQNEL